MCHDRGMDEFKKYLAYAIVVAVVDVVNIPLIPIF
jgi:hypothetical protein